MQDSIIETSMEHHINNSDTICLKQFINILESITKSGQTDRRRNNFYKINLYFYEGNKVEMFKSRSKYEWSKHL